MVINKNDYSLFEKINDPLIIFYGNADVKALQFESREITNISSVAPVYKNVGERYMAKYYRPFSLLCVVSEVFEKLVNNRIVDHPEKCVFFLISIMILGLLILLYIF